MIASAFFSTRSCIAKLMPDAAFCFLSTYFLHDSQYFHSVSACIRRIILPCCFSSTARAFATRRSKNTRRSRCACLSTSFHSPNALTSSPFISFCTTCALSFSSISLYLFIMRVLRVRSSNVTAYSCSRWERRPFNSAFSSFSRLTTSIAMMFLHSVYTCFSFSLSFLFEKSTAYFHFSTSIPSFSACISSRSCSNFSNRRVISSLFVPALAFNRALSFANSLLLSSTSRTRSSNVVTFVPMVSKKLDATAITSDFGLLASS
mmetsp:Transcript_47345/g.122474  ORF Transcript_47345/g.122474 Transcript_47345/m.122474 type:complete len:262 (-) Transcript_47345:396-1181(-)